jgi:hypothetical protein
MHKRWREVRKEAKVTRTGNESIPVTIAGSVAEDDGKWQLLFVPVLVSWSSEHSREFRPVTLK